MRDVRCDTRIVSKLKYLQRSMKPIPKCSKMLPKTTHPCYMSPISEIAFAKRYRDGDLCDSITIDRFAFARETCPNRKSILTR